MFHTQLEYARKGTITEAMYQVARSEKRDPEWVRAQVACGKVAIPCNRLHQSLMPSGVGEGLRTKINVNLGVSKDCGDYSTEMQKAKLALSMGAEAIMDLSCHGQTAAFREALIKTSTAMVGTVPMYDILDFAGKTLKDLSKEDFLAVVKAHGESGVDFITIHAGLNQETLGAFERNPRVTGIVSRGGSLLYAWMKMNDAENPYYAYYDELLEICRAYDMTLSLGDAMRPGSIADATDASQIKELMVLGELVKRAWAAGVQVMVEGPGHMAISDIPANVLLQKRLCHGAPFYVLGPLVTDIAPGYDHITSAIGGAIAAANGADFLCYVTPAEHLRLPDLDDVKAGIVAAKIAAHAGDIAKGIAGASERDLQMSERRQALDWEGMFNLAIDPEKARAYRASSQPSHEDSCTMCGELCAMKNVRQIQSGKPVEVG